MCPGSGADLRKLLKSVLHALEVGDWRRARRLLVEAKLFEVGLESLVRGIVALEHAARAMQLHAQGFVFEAFDEFGIAATQLPRLRTGTTATPGRAIALLMPEPDDPRSDEHLTWRIARVVWRGQSELGDLRRRFAPGRMRARDELVEACIEHLCCVEFDPFAWPESERPTPDDGVTVDRTRLVLCHRATRLRQFADPTRGEVTQSVWRDIGAYRRLRGAALSQLATRTAPAPWCGVRGTSGLKVCRGRLRAWQYAHIWSDDLKYWNQSEEMP
jgi:hypothetical protein